jgi:arginase
MQVYIFAVPYDSALRNRRMGAGPDHILQGGLTEALRADGHEVHVEHVVIDDPMPAEIRTAFELNRQLASRVRTVTAHGGLPVVLAGNCVTAAGTLAGVGADGCGVLWFDSHGDFNTPETTTGGFLDGMALAITTGRCWSQLALGIPGFTPVTERNVILLGTRDVDPLEQELLDGSGITVLPPVRFRDDLANVLGALRARTPDVYVHLDLDVIDPHEGRANSFAAADGLSVAEMRTALCLIQADFHIRAVAVTACDPSCDVDGRVRRAAIAFVRDLLPPG